MPDTIQPGRGAGREMDAQANARPCSLGRRLLVMAYDAAAVVALLMLVTALIMLAGFRELSATRDPLYAAGLLSTWFLYLGWCWRHGGMTLGMRAWKVRVETLRGGMPGWGVCLLRFAVSLLSGAAAGVGFLWSLFDPQRRCWHDIASGTRLLRC
jgi:uncharacterized RDD family membrane protein YckC